jgi:hypothetical protein
LASNYTFTGGTQTASITAASLGISAVTDSKVYDGGVTSAGVVTFAGLVSGDTVTGATQAFGSKNVLGAGASTLLVNAGYSVNDGNAGGNYTVTTSNATGTITAKPVTLTAPSVSKIYDGGLTYTTAAGDLTALATSLVGGDSVTAATIAYTNKNAGTGNKTVNLNSATINDGNSGLNYSVSLAGNATSTITAASLGINAVTDTKVYDGGTTSAGVVTFTGLVSGDTVTGATQSFGSKNALGAGASTLLVNAGYTVNDGNAGGNYTVTKNTATGTITPLASVAWTGGVSGNWSLASNWAGGALPDASNVLAVTIPSGSTVTYDPATANTTLNTLISSGALTLAGGAGSILTVNSQLTTPQFAMTSGSLTGTGNLTVSNSYSQSGGTIALTGAAKADITQTSGNLLVGSLAAPTVTLAAQAGAISQSAPIVASNLITQSATGTTLNDTGNKIASFTATNSGSGNVELTNTGTLSIGGIGNTGGNITVDNTGAVTTTGAISAPAGAVSIVAHSPLSIGTGGVSAGGNITLTAGGTAVLTDNLTLNGVVQTTGSTSSIALSAGGSIMSGAGFSGANLIGGSATLVAGGNANLSTQVNLLDLTGIQGTYSIFDLLTGSLLTNVPTTAPTTVTDQVVSTVVATTQQQPIQTEPPPLTIAPATSGSTLLTGSTQTIGGTADAFGDSSQSDKPADDKKDDDKTKGEGTAAKKDEGKPAAKKLATCS